jgi:hypothetical protein
MCPFYFADRFSGAVVHLTTCNPSGLPFAARPAFSAETFHENQNKIQTKSLRQSTVAGFFMQILRKSAKLLTQTEFFDQSAIAIQVFTLSGKPADFYDG